MEHKLVDNTLTVSHDNPAWITATCVCGWTSSGHFNSFGAITAFWEHKDAAEVTSEKEDGR